MIPRNSRMLQPGAVMGLVLAAIGAILLLRNLGYLHLRGFWDFPPIVLIVFGVANFLCCGHWPGRVWGLLLACGGGYWLLDRYGYVRYSIWQMWPAFLILLGCVLIWRALSGPAGGREHSTSYVRELAILGGGKRALVTDDFRGGQAMAAFGGVELDLTGAAIREDLARVDASAVFGGVEIRVPREWIVDCQGIAILGGYEDKTKGPADPSKPAKRLIVQGFAMFGGVEIKN